MIADERSSEIRLLIALLVLVAIFTFWLIPNSIEDPEGFGYAQGLAPSFSAYVVAIIATITLLLRLLRVLKSNPINVHPTAQSSQSESSELVQDEPGKQKRAWMIIGTCLLFAFVLIPYVGFYISSFAFVVLLAIVMGEHRPVMLIALPVLLLVAVYLGFEEGFTISLPRGELILLILDAMESS